MLSLIPVEDDEDAIRVANESNYGLSGSVLTHDVDAAYRIARRVRTGGMGQNGLRLDFGLPFGGFKQSGVGREGGIEGLKTCLEKKRSCLMGCHKNYERGQAKWVWICFLSPSNALGE